MDVENIFRDVKLSKMEMTVLRFIQNDPEQCIRQGVRAVARLRNPRTEKRRLLRLHLDHF